MNKILRSEVSNLRMTTGNEDVYTIVIDDGILKEWVGIGWIELGPATEEDRTKYPELES